MVFFSACAGQDLSTKWMQGATALGGSFTAKVKAAGATTTVKHELSKTVRALTKPTPSGM